MTGPAAAAGVRFRDAGSDDLPAVLRLLAQDSMQYFGPEPTRPTTAHEHALREISADPNQTLVVGVIDEEVVATAQLSFMRMIVGGGALYAQVEAVRTDDELRGRGIGGRLMEHLEGLARERGAARLQLTSNLTRTDAHRFYERLGFTGNHLGMKKHL